MMIVPTVCLLFLLSGVHCSNILVIFNAPGKSHSILGEKLSEGLINRGHHVTFVTPFTSEHKTENLTEIHLKSIFEYRENQMTKSKIGPSTSRISLLFFMKDFFMDLTRLFWETPGIQKIIHEKPKYDVLILVNFFNDHILGLAHHLGVPAIIFSCVGSNSIGNKYMGNPNMVYSPNMMFTMHTDSFFGRLFGVTTNMLMNFFFDSFMDPYQETIMKKFLPDAPSLYDLKQNVSLMLVNSHFSIEPARPYVPNMIQIGGFHIRDPKELPQDIKSFLDDAKQGAILFSMGSNILLSSMEEEKLACIFKVLGDMAPMKVLFKSEMDHKNVPKNIMVKKWLPQVDILGHPNIQVFISHGGLGGNTETVYHGVPILGIPFLGDQKMNLAEAERAGYAVVIYHEAITEESFRMKLKEVIENPKYRKNVRMRSALMKQQPVKPMDNAAYWIEHIIKYGGGSHLRNAGMDLAWYQFYMIDIYVFYTIVICLVVVISYYMLRLSLKIVRQLFFQTKSKMKVN